MCVPDNPQVLVNFNGGAFNCYDQDGEYIYGDRFVLLLRDYLPAQLSMSLIRIYNKKILSAVPEAEIIHYPQNSVYSEKQAWTLADLPKVYKEDMLWVDSTSDHRNFINSDRGSNERYSVVGMKFKYPAKVSNYVYMMAVDHDDHYLYLRDDFPTSGSEANFNVNLNGNA